MTEFKQRELGDDGTIRVNVKDQKTVDTYGSAPLMFYPSEFEWVSTFINNFRSKTSKINTDYVFISWNENKMTLGDISGRLHSQWEKAGIFENRVVPKKLCINIIRKSASTLVRQTDKEKSQVVADSMLHSLNTAEQHYARRNIEIAAAKGGQTIRRVFKEKTNPIPTRKSWSKDEIKILEESFRELIVTKELREKK